MTEKRGWFGALLRLLPEDFRERHGDGMLDLYRTYADERHPLLRWSVWLRAAWDVVWIAASLRLRRAASPPNANALKRLLGDGLGQDVRHAFRSLRRDRGLATFGILTVGLGIGACVTVYGVTHALLIRPLPFERDGELVWISNGDWGRGQALSELSVQVAHVQALQDHSSTLGEVAGFFLFDREGDHAIEESGNAERLSRLRVTGNFLGMLGVEPSIGRLFTDEEAAWGAPPVILLTHGLWARRFGSDPDVVGATVVINGQPSTVVGVLPSTFDFASVFAPGNRYDFLAPFPLSAETNRQGNTLALIALLRPGASPRAAEREARDIIARTATDRLNDFEPRVTPLREHVSGGFRQALVVLTTSVGLVMLIVCANLSSLLLARGQTRTREMAVRAALGAGRGRIIRQVAVESLLIALSGAALGVLVAAAGTRFVASLDATVPLLADVTVDGSALGLAFGIAVVAGLLFGLVPALRASRRSSQSSLRDHTRGASAGLGQSRLRGALVAIEVALACVLLVGAGLLVRSFAALVTTDPGFEPQGAVAMRVDPPRSFETRESEIAYFDGVLAAARSVSGVRDAGLVDVLPVAFNRRWCVRPVSADPERRVDCIDAFIRIVSEGYVPAMGLTLLSGRALGPGDNAEGRPVIMVNETLAGSFWPGQDPVGRVIPYGGAEWEVVGVVRGMRHLTLEQPPGPEVFFPVRQMPDFGPLYLVARGDGSPATIQAPLRGALRAFDPGLPLGETRMIEDILDQSLSARRFVVLLLTGFSGFAVLLACLGLYGVVSYAVSQRRREIGVRMAVGASAGAVRRGVLAQSLWLTGSGLVVGLVAAAWLARLLEGLLYAVPPFDPITFLTVAAVLSGVGYLAAYLPARKASLIDPLEALTRDG